MIIAVNKWDLIEEKETNTAVRGEQELKESAPFLAFIPFLYISAKTGQRVTKLFELIVRVAEERRKRVPTAEVNRVLEDAHSAPAAAAARRGVGPAAVRGTDQHGAAALRDHLEPAGGDPGVLHARIC